MKMNKRLILILIVLAVTAYLLWKKGVFAKDESAGAGTGGNAGAKSTKAIIDALTGVAGSHKDYLRKYCEQIESDPEKKASVEAKAADNGVTYAQQAVMDASYVLYYTNETGVWKPKADWAAWYHEELVKQVMAMS